MQQLDLEVFNDEELTRLRYAARRRVLDHGIHADVSSIGWDCAVEQLRRINDAARSRGLSLLS